MPHPHPTSARPMIAPSRLRLICLASMLSIAAIARAQNVVNPADKQRPPEAVDEELAIEGDTYQYGSTVVTARRMNEYREEDRIGPYDQPAWTAYRRFPTTRIYVRPPGSFGFEYWLRPTIPKHGPAKIQTQYEFEIGLPNRFQFDFYIVNNSEGHDGPSEFNEQKLELRYAFADWGKIWGNPTAYVEYKFSDPDFDAYELKLLLGDELAPSWHWGTNLVYERELGGSLENVYELTAGVSKTLKDEQFSLGAEIKTSLADEHDDRGDFSEELLIGPSLQYRPTQRIHMDIAALAGIGNDSPDAQFFFVLGYDF